MMPKAKRPKKPPKKTTSSDDTVEEIFKFKESRDAFEKLGELIEDLFGNEQGIARRRMLIAMTKVLCSMDTNTLILLMTAMLEMNKPDGYGLLADSRRTASFVKDGAYRAHETTNQTN